MDSESPSEKAIRKLATAEGIDQADLDPIFNSVEPDALDAIFQNLSNGPARDEGKVEFTHEGYTVTVHADGGVSIDE